MNSRKFNIFSFIMVAVMCVFTICVAFTFKGEDGTDGTDGKSAYELAVENGYTGTEVEYLMSLQGEDGSSVTVDDLYNTYLTVSGKTSDEVTYIEFVQTYFDDLVNVVDVTTQTELATQIALRSTVDICYSYSVSEPIIYGTFYEMITYGSYSKSSNFTISNTTYYSSEGVAAGSGIIYKMEDTDNDNEYDVAYIITNYHVLYCDGYLTEEYVADGYRVYYDYIAGTYFTAYYGTSDNNIAQRKNIMSSTYYISSSDLEYAPIYTHFLESYNIYVYGYQDEQYAISATYVGGSADNDIAVLKVERNTENEFLFSGNYVAATTGDSSEISTGESVIAVGNPLLASYSSSDTVEAVESAYIDSLCLTATSGVVSNISEYCTMTSIVDSSSTITLRLIRVDAAINAGNSGGGLYDLSGKLIGIVNAKIADEDYDNVGYAIPINIASRIADQIISQCDDQDETTTQINVVNSSSLGITVSNGESSTYFDGTTWVIKNNIVIKNIDEAGLAYAAGLRQGDIIVSITVNGITYTTEYDDDEYSGLDNIKSIKNDYDIDNILLNVIYGESSTYEISIEYMTTAGGTTTQSKTIIVSNSDFVTLT